MSDATSAGADPRRWLVLATASIGTFVALVDFTVVTFALSRIADGIGTSLAAASWVASAYSLAFVVFLIPAGRLADVFGRRRFMLGGLALFGLASLACGAAPALGVLVVFRVLQAIGATVLMPVSLALIRVVFPARETGMAVGVWAAFGSLAAAAGPTIAGLVLDAGSWRWLFWINVPVCLVAVAIGWRVIPESRDPAASRRVDLRGVAVLAVAGPCLVMGLIEGGARGWGSPLVVGLLVASALLVLVFVLVERREAEPLVDLRLLRDPAFAAPAAAYLPFALAVIGVVFLEGAFAPDVWGYSPLQAALALAPFYAIGVVMVPFMGALSDRLGVRALAGPGALLFLLGILGLLSLGTDADPVRLVVLNTVMGLGVAMVSPTLLAGAVASLPLGRAGVGGGVVMLSRQIGFVLGLAVVVAVIESATPAADAAAGERAALVVADAPVSAGVRAELRSAIDRAPSDRVDAVAATADRIRDRPVVAASDRRGLREIPSEVRRVTEEERRDVFPAAVVVCAVAAALTALLAFASPSAAGRLRVERAHRRSLVHERGRVADRA